MTNKPILILIFILFFVASCSTPPSSSPLPENKSLVKPASETSTNNNEETTKTEVPPQDTDSVLSEAEKKQLQQEKQPYQSPDDAIKSRQTDDQIMTEAIENKDVKKCQEISDPDLEKTCINNVNDIKSSTTTSVN